MKRGTAQRALRYFAGAALAVSFFEACSNDDTVVPPGPAGPASVAITQISLGQGVVGQGGASSTVLGCDHTIAVALQVTDWTLRPQGVCATTKCGQVRVSLLGPDGSLLTSQVAATTGVALDLSRFFAAGEGGAGGTQGKLLEPGTYTIQAQLVDDAGTPYAASDGSSSSTEQSFSMVPDCTSGVGAPGEAGAAGTSAAAGAGGVPGAKGAPDAGAAGESSPSSAGESSTGGASGASGAAGA